MKRNEMIPVEELLISISRCNQKEFYIVNRKEFDDMRTLLLEDESSQESFSKWIEKLRSHCISHGKSIPYHEFRKSKKSFVGDIRIPDNTEYLEEYALGNAYG